MHRLVGWLVDVVAEGHGIALLIFSLETGSRSKADKEERREKWRTDEKTTWERTVWNGNVGEFATALNTPLKYLIVNLN